MYISKNSLSVVFSEGAEGAGGDGGYFCSVWLKKKLILYILKHSNEQSLLFKTKSKSKDPVIEHCLLNRD